MERGKKLSFWRVHHTYRWQGCSTEGLPVFFPLIEEMYHYESQNPTLTYQQPTFNLLKKMLFKAWCPEAPKLQAEEKSLCLGRHYHPPCMATDLAALLEPTYMARVKRYRVQFITILVHDLNRQAKEKKILGRNNQKLQLRTQGGTFPWV